MPVTCAEVGIAKNAPAMKTNQPISFMVGSLPAVFWGQFPSLSPYSPTPLCANQFRHITGVAHPSVASHRTKNSRNLAARPPLSALLHAHDLAIRPLQRLRQRAPKWPGRDCPLFHRFFRIGFIE